MSQVITTVFSECSANHTSSSNTCKKEFPMKEIKKRKKRFNRNRRLYLEYFPVDSIDSEYQNKLSMLRIYLYIHCRNRHIYLKMITISSTYTISKIEIYIFLPNWSSKSQLIHLHKLANIIWE